MHSPRIALSMALFLVGGLAAIPAFAAEGGGSGLRGGSGVFCPSESEPVVLEDYVLSGPRGGDEAIDARALLAKLPESHRTLREIVLSHLLRNGTLETWATEADVSDLLRAAHRHANATLDTHSRNGLYRVHLGPHAEYWRLSEDDPAFELPGDCFFVQLAVTPVTTDLRAVGPVLLPFGRALKSPRQRAFLELHEALHGIGAVWYAHASPAPTRRLLTALVRFPAGAPEIAVAADAFVLPETNSVRHHIRIRMPTYLERR